MNKLWITFSLIAGLLCGEAHSQGKLYELDSAKYGPGRVYYKTETEAIFPGGNDRIIDFFKTRFDAGVETDMVSGPKEGFVDALFIVETNGKVKYVEITKHYTNAYDEEMISTILAMPKWQPATINGKPV